MATQTLKLPQIAEGQGQPHVTHNEALDLIDALFHRVVASATLASPPLLASRPDPSAYIVPAGGSGYGGAAPGDIALWIGGAWVALTPKPGWRWYVADEAAHRVYAAGKWRRGDVAGALGSSLELVVAERVLTLAGASVAAAGLIPARAIVLGVTSWTVQAVTGAASYSVGRQGGDLGAFGSALGIAPGSQNVGVVGPFATYAAETVVVTSAGGAFTGGQVGLSVAALVPRGPV